MPEFLSPAWIAAADAALNRSGIRSASTLVVQNEVAGEDGSLVAYHLTVDGSGAGLATGYHRDPTVTYRLGWATAQGIADGDLDPYSEFMSGRLEVAGDTMALVAHLGVLEDVQAAIAAVGTS